MCRFARLCRFPLVAWQLALTGRIWHITPHKKTNGFAFVFFKWMKHKVYS